MKKINKTLLLASTLFVSSAITVADKSYADEGYDLNVEPSKADTLDNIETQTDEQSMEVSQDASSIFNEENEDFANYESQTNPNSLTPQEQTPDQELLDDSLETTDIDSLEIDSVEDQNLTTYELSENEDTLEDEDTVEKELLDSKNLEETTEDKKVEEEKEEKKEDLTKENIGEIIYYDDKNLDEIFNSTYKENNHEQSIEIKENSESKEEETKLEEKNYYAPKGTGYFVNEGNSLRYYENNKLVKNSNVIVNDKFYEIDNKGNAINPKSLWGRIDSNIYYMDKNGSITKGIKEINNKKYYFNNKGHLQRNKLIVTGMSFYDIGDNGIMVNPTNKWLSLNNKKYYNDKDGKLLKGIAKVNNTYYYFDTDGVLTRNKKLITEDRYYVVDRNGVARNPKNSWFTMSGKTYRSDNEGKIAKGAKTIDNNLYVFDQDGKLAQNRSIISAGKFYKTNAKGLATVVKNSWAELDGKKYHTNANGYVKEGVWKIDGQYYYFTQNGLTANQVITQKGVLYTVNDKGIAKKQDNNVKGEKNLDKVLEWMFTARDKKMTYNMGAGRNSATQADCSSAVYRSLIYGGFLNKGSFVGNTETLFKMGAKGKVMYEVKENELQYGDIFVAGKPGASVGAGGHTGFILNPYEDTIIHMGYSANGVAITQRKGNMGDSRGLPVKYFRLVGANSNALYLNKK